MANPGRRARKKEERRSLILRVGRDLFARLGFDGASVEAIAEAADVSAGTVYNFFPSKIDILAAVQIEAIEQAMAARLTAAGPPPADAAEGLLRLVDHQLRALAALDRRDIRLVTAHALLNGRASPIGRAYAAADAYFQGQIADRLAAYRAAGALDPATDTLALAALIFSAINGEYYDWLADDAATVETTLARVRRHFGLIFPAPEPGFGAAVAPSPA